MEPSAADRAALGLLILVDAQNAATDPCKSPERFCPSFPTPHRLLLEWLQDRMIEYRNNGATVLDAEDANLLVSNETPRIRRGGPWSHDKETMRSAHRGSPGGYAPNDRKDSVGFRVGRTVN